MILESLKRQAALNVRLFSGDRARLLIGDANHLASALEGSGLKQSDIGSLIGLSQSAVSRLKKRTESSDTRLEAASHG